MPNASSGESLLKKTPLRPTKPRVLPHRDDGLPAVVIKEIIERGGPEDLRMRRRYLGSLAVPVPTVTMNTAGNAKKLDMGNIGNVMEEGFLILPSKPTKAPGSRGAKKVAIHLPGIWVPQQ